MAFLECKNEGRNPDENASLWRLEFMQKSRLKMPFKNSISGLAEISKLNDWIMGWISQVYLGSCVQLYSLAETPQLPPLPPPFWPHIRGRYWSVKIETTFLCNPWTECSPSLVMSACAAGGRGGGQEGGGVAGAVHLPVVAGEQGLRRLQPATSITHCWKR